MMVSWTVNDDESDNEWRRMTTKDHESENEQQQTTASDIE